MASSGPNSPSSGVNDAGVGSVAWGNPERVVSNNNSKAFADMSLDTDVTNYLVATSFGFAIPAGATINGIVAEVEQRQPGTSGVVDNRVRIVKGGTIGGTDRSSSVPWPGSDAYASYGGSSDLWGETWTADDINASTFGLAISAKNTVVEVVSAQVDHIRITVHYTEVVTGHPAAKRMSGVAFAGSVLPQSALKRW